MPPTACGGACLVGCHTSPHASLAPLVFNCSQVDYYTFVSSIADFGAIPRAQRLGRPYRDYLQVGAGGHRPVLLWWAPCLAGQG